MTDPASSQRASDPHAAEFIEELARSDRNATEVLVQLREGQAAILRLWLTLSEKVVTREKLPDGEFRVREIKRSDIDDVIFPVSSERLEQLDPGDPKAYRDYAEELAEKCEDPDARATAIRLYVLAAYLGSDVLALLPYTREVVYLEDGDVAELGAGSLSITDLEGQPIERAEQHIDWDAEAASKGGFEHHMLKEIHEQPDVVARTAFDRILQVEDDVLFR